MAVELRCPECRAKLKLGEAPEAGTEVECPKCGTVFPAPEPEPSGDDEAPAKKPLGDFAKPKKDKDKDKDRDGSGEGKKKDKKPKAAADPKGPKKRKAKKKETSNALLIGVVGAGLLLLAFASGVLIYFFTRTSKSVEMMYYLPEDADTVQGLNLGHAQKYPEFYKALSGTFNNTEFKAAGDGLGRALGFTDLDGLTDYVVFGSNVKGHSAMVFRSKADFNPEGLGKLPGAKQQSADGRNYYLVDGFRAGSPKVRVFAPTNRLVVVCPADLPDPVFKKVLSGNAGSQDKTVGARMGDLGKRTTRGTFWSMTLFEGEKKPPTAPTAPAGGGAGAGAGNDDANAQLARTTADGLSGAKGYGFKASIGSREVRFELIVWCSSGEKSSNMSKKWNESDLGKGDEGTPPKWWKEGVDSLGNKKIGAQLLANLGFGSSGDLFYAKSAVDTVDLKDSVSSFAGKVNPAPQNNAGGPGMGGPGVGGPGMTPGPKPRRRVWARR